MKKLINFLALPNKVRFEFNWQTLAKCTQADALASTNTGGVISSVKLRTQFYHVPQMKRTARYQRIQHPLGLATKFSSIETHRREGLTSGAIGIQRIKLRNIKNDTYMLRVVARTTADVDGDAAVGVNLTNFKTIDLLELDDNGSRVTTAWLATDSNAEASDVLWGPRLNPTVCNRNKFFMGQPIYILPLCEPSLIKKSDEDAFGSRAIAKYNNPELVMTFTGAIASNYYIDIWGYVHNIIIQKKGDIKKYLG